MKHLPWVMVALVVDLAIIFNIERLDYGQENVIDIASFVYVLGLLAVVAVIGVPGLRRWRAAALGAVLAGAYFVLKAAFFTFLGGHPLIGGIYTYLSITELALLMFTVWLAHKTTRAIVDFEEAVRKVTFPDSNKRIRQLDDAVDEIQLEMFRSRHYHHPLSIVVVKPAPGVIESSLHQAVQEIQQAMLHTYLLNSMARGLSGYIRRTDLILEQRDEGRFIILCPDTNAEDLRLLAEYIQAIAQEQMGTQVVCGTASFPDEAITFEELLRQAEARLNPTNGREPSSSGDAYYPVTVKSSLADRKEAEDQLIIHVPS
jgi:hypothetical protein